jgi:hypothetical protein
MAASFFTLLCYQFADDLTPDFAFECTHKCFMHLKVALSIALIVVMELFLLFLNAKSDLKIVIRLPEGKRGSYFCFK